MYYFSKTNVRIILKIVKEFSITNEDDYCDGTVSESK